MTEKDLLKKLNSYKDIQADPTWKKENREVLFNQIMNSSSAPESGFSFAKLLNTFKIYSDTFYNSIVKNMGQPVILTSLIVLSVLGGGVMSINASRDTTPGDSLYIAKKISEKTQLTFTFSEKKKAQLNVVFAENRAREISQVMSDEKTDEEKKEIVERLTGDFKKEISNVKTRIEKIALKDKVNRETGEGGLGQEENKNIVEPAEENLFTANLGKGDEGLSIGGIEPEIVPIVEEVKEDEETVVIEEVESTTTIEVIETEEEVATSSVEAKEVIEEDGSQDILNEVRDLLESDDFDGSLEKLSEVSDSFDQEIEDGEVKGIIEEVVVVEEESATSTEE
ncbi:MAG: DUF5667 domain-containing protein [Patescibacteria group bacterium]|jgi:hypothetical protein|nr:DUF5667 domain-containing protein [Patescibacteria group bacterium]